MDASQFWLWTILFVFTGYLIVKIFCVCFLDPRQNNFYLPLLQHHKVKTKDNTTNIDYSDYVSIVSTNCETIN